jgi:hypothetical protein
MKAIAGRKNCSAKRGEHSFAREKARNRTWREIARRPLDWASRSLQRELEVVIMVEVLIGEMFGVEPLDYERAVVVDAAGQRKRTTPLSRVNEEVCLKKS